MLIDAWPPTRIDPGQPDGATPYQPTVVRSAQLAAGLAEPFVGGIPYTRAVKLLQMNPVITFHYKTFGHLLQYHQLFHTHQSSQFVVLRKGLAKNQFQNGAIVQCSPVGAELGSSSCSWPPRIDRRSWQA